MCVCVSVCLYVRKREIERKGGEGRGKQPEMVVTRSFIKILFTWSPSIMPLLKHNNRPPWITFCPELVKKNIASRKHCILVIELAEI